MNRKAIIGTIVALGSAGFVAWRVLRPMGADPVPHVAVVWDRSLSVRSGCIEVSGLAERAMKEHRLTSRSTIVVMATGEGSRLGEPIEIDRLGELKSRRVMEGRGGAARREHAALGELERQCALLSRTKSSPIHLAVRRAIEALRAMGCTDGSSCGLYVASDLEETAEATIVRALAGNARALNSLPAALDNTGIRVRFCGLADTAGADGSGKNRRPRQRDARHADRIAEVWRALFQRPDLVSFEPHCPKGTPREGSSASGRSP